MKIKFESRELIKLGHQIVAVCNTLLDHKNEPIEDHLHEIKELHSVAEKLTETLEIADRQHFAEAYAERQLAEATEQSTNLQREAERDADDDAKEKEAESFGERFVNNLLRDPRRFS